MRSVVVLLSVLLSISTIDLSAQTYVFSQAQFGVGSVPIGQVSADFNGDSFPDLAVANGASNTVSILLGNRQGTFRPHVDYPVAGANSIVAGDFNGDSKLDLAVAGFGKSNISILLGNGDGTFKPYTPVPRPRALTSLLRISMATASST